MTRYLGIDVGGTTVKSAIIENGKLDESSRLVYKTIDDKEKVIALLKKIIAESPNISAVGISFPGLIINNGYLSTAGAIRSMYRFDLQAELAKDIDLPIYILNDANAAAVAEKDGGSAQGLIDYVLVAVGTGIGGGIIINGQLYTGQKGMAGEFGFMSMDTYDEEKGEDLSLSFEGSTVTGLIRHYRLSSGERVADAREIFAKCEAGDKFAISAVDRFYTSLAQGILNIIVCIDPQKVIISGGITNRPQFIDELNAKLREMQKSRKRYRDLEIAPVVSAKYRADAGIIGAAYYAKQKHKN
jgi:predicted NBD/HSP70 family sugar kinase